MLQQNNQQQMEMPTENIALQFGGPELMHMHESIGALTGAIEHIRINAPKIKDKQLSSIVMAQEQYITKLYNVILETVHTAKEPQQKMADYMMQQTDPKTTFGLTPKPPKKPIQQPTEITDECISSAILGHLKGIASGFTMSALESTHPVLRRVIADSVPNIIEMAYEVFLYENQKGSYEVPQYSGSDMLQIINSYSKLPDTPIH